MRKINVAIVGIGNCASNFVQGIEYYKKEPNSSDGLMYRKVGDYDISDISIVAAFDIAEGKVGKDLSEAIFASPNCTEKICDMPQIGVTVKRGPVLDGWDTHFEGVVKVFETDSCDIKEILIESQTDIMVILLPTGAKLACYEYMKTALNLGIGVVNGIPVLATHDESIIKLAEDNKACIIGDDFKSQIGGTILHHSLLHLLNMRGIVVKKSYQLNYAGNTDFLNLMTNRGNDKHASKKRGIIAGEYDDLDISVNVSYIENQCDNKSCIIVIEGENFAGCPVKLECKLNVVDSANSSGVLVDAIRSIAIAKKLGMYGRLDGPSAYFMKSPYIQMPDEKAFAEVNKLFGINNK